MPRTPDRTADTVELAADAAASSSPGARLSRQALAAPRRAAGGAGWGRSALALLLGAGLAAAMASRGPPPALALQGQGPHKISPPRVELRWRASGPCVTWAELLGPEETLRSPAVRAPDGTGWAAFEKLDPVAPYRARFFFAHRFGGPAWSSAEVPLPGRGPVRFEQVQVVDQTSDQATLRFRTNLPALVRAELGLSPRYTQTISPADDTPRTQHELRATGLIPDQAYHFRLWAALPGHPETRRHSPDQSFRTRAGALVSSTLRGQVRDLLRPARPRETPTTFRPRPPIPRRPRRPRPPPAPMTREDLVDGVSTARNFLVRAQELSTWLDELAREGRLAGAPGYAANGRDAVPPHEALAYLRSLSLVNMRRARYRLDELVEILAEYAPPVSGP